LAKEVTNMASKSKKSEVDIHHEELVRGLLNQMKVIFESSEQPMYLYLDDNHWECNKRFSDLLGYNSPEELVSQQLPLLDALVSEKSQDSLVTAYGNAMEKKVGSTIEVTWKKNNGRTVDTNVILVPIAYEGHLFALHFLSALV
jgi:PAS domain S-box-containing protein